MHLLIVTQYFWPENFRINDLVEGLHQRGHRITVLTGHPNYPSGRFTHGYTGRQVVEEQFGGIRVLRVPMLARGQGSGARLMLNYLSFALSGSVLGARLARDRYDAIFVYEPSPMTVGFPAMTLKRLSGRPIAFYIQDLWPESLSATGFVKNPVALKAVEWMVRGIYKACDQILVTSRAFIPRVQRLGVPAERISYYPQYAESFYAPRPRDPRWAQAQGIPEGFTVMFAGNMGVAQDLFTVLDAAERLRDQNVNWVFVGDGSVRQQLEAQARERGLTRVYFLGSHPAQEMPQFFAQADALLVSLTRDDLFALTVPAKIQSYLACGRPILASLAGEGAEIVREAHAGVTCPPQDGAALAEAVRTLQALPSEARETMGQQGRAYFEAHFEREQLLTQLEETLMALRSTK
ncbi:glycosyltransferase family 4 protein [Deinococcus maricopensis]|uniref:Glycosyl transferase group 1 n=1 Tax=Deinococcus maricopensis (strain DSM 21211 / LMG 22137 / NRRL B-23946 / LB-34) TaxID=709986 RepID=E8UC05_DEIML|nr:glycosyltransferase family 4 protein [Deinococcus maricopensis]ADV68594.1 glycosyl transferase group 1 [Deinococcus maricopensis DSM 21211]